MRDDRERLNDILEAIHNIERYVYDENGQIVQGRVNCWKSGLSITCKLSAKRHRAFRMNCLRNILKSPGVA